MKNHVVSVKLYIAIFLTLMVFTFVTVWVSTINFGFMNDVVAMTIAVIKMLLVALFFMHLKYQARLVWLIAGAGLIWLVIMFSITLSDFMTREMIVNPQPWTAITVEHPSAHSGEHSAEHSAEPSPAGH